MSPRVIEIADGLSALVSFVPVDGRVSWLSDKASGIEPYNIYFKEKADRLLVVDTGVALHGDALIEHLKYRLGNRHLIVFNTRAELECIGNLQRILSVFPDVQLVTACPLDPLDLVHLDAIPLRHPPADFLAFGDTLEKQGFPELVAVRPVIKTLGTGWLFDAETKALFTSDAFGADLLASESDSLLRTRTAGAPSLDELRETMLAKFDWFRIAQPKEFTQAWETCLEKRPIDILAPIHGRIQLGRDVVEYTLGKYKEALGI